ncbi:MAG: hypothetical protein AAB772_02160 [Patescibacteria group bacterium]
MFRKIAALIIIILILLAVYFIYEYRFAKPVEAPIIKAKIPVNQPVIPQTILQTDIIKPTTGFRGPAGMPFINGPTEQPPGQ